MISATVSRFIVFVFGGGSIVGSETCFRAQRPQGRLRIAKVRVLIAQHADGKSGDRESASKDRDIPTVLVGDFDAFPGYHTQSINAGSDESADRIA